MYYFLIFLIILLFIGWLLPILAPVFLFFIILALLRSFFGNRNRSRDAEDTYFYNDTNDQSDYTYSNPPKHDAIDVEYTEREDDGDTQ